MFKPVGKDPIEREKLNKQERGGIINNTRLLKDNGQWDKKYTWGIAIGEKWYHIFLT